MRRHDQMRQFTLSGRRLGQHAKFVGDAIRSKTGQQLQLRLTRAACPPIRQIDDLALARAVDGAVRLLDETRQRSRMPMIAPRLALRTVHALLHNRPLAIIGDEETVQIEIETILERRTVYLGYQTTCARQCRRIDADAIAE